MMLMRDLKMLMMLMMLIMLMMRDDVERKISYNMCGQI